MATRIPITKESSLRFDDHQKRIWEEMETDMEKRRREWEDEIDKMRKEFFAFRPEDQGLGSGLGSLKGQGGSAIPLGVGERLGPRSRLLETSSSADDSRGMVVKDEKGNPVYKVLFDVHDYRPEEVAVKLDSSNKLMVSARHAAQQGGSTVSREFSRQVSIPSNIDPLTLQCTMGPDGVLAVEAPIPAPSYAALKDTATSLPVRSASPAASSSSASSSSSTPVHQSSTSSSYQTSYQRGADPTYPAGYKPVSSQSSQPASSLKDPASSSSSSSSTSSTSGYAKVSPPFQALSSQQAAPSYSPPLKASSAGRMGSSPAVVSEPGMFRVEIDIEDFKPEELTVKTQDKRVVVCAKREEKVGNSSSTRELSRERTLPDSVDPHTVKAFFTDAGRLMVEAPYRDAAAASSHHLRQSQASGR